MTKKSTSWYGFSRLKDRPGQGDFLNSVPILTTKEPLPREGAFGTPQIRVYDAVVVSQSCDLTHANKINRVQVAPVEKLDVFLASHKSFNTAERLEALRKNNVPRYYLMNVNRSSAFNKLGYLIADFGSIHSISMKTLTALCDQQPRRLRLISPYREQLSQHFARFYMRVGLPNDIPEFKDKRRLR